MSVPFLVVDAASRRDALPFLDPDLADAHFQLANALVNRRAISEAISQYHETLRLNPESLLALNNLAWLLATQPEAQFRNGPEAVQLAERTNQLAGGENPIILRTVAAAYAEAGRFGDAVRSAQKAIELARAAGRQDLVEQLNVELKLYAAGLPFHAESK